jgi:hypothetical protein
MKFGNNLLKFSQIYLLITTLFLSLFAYACERANLNLLLNTLKSEKLSKNQFLNLLEKLNLTDIDVRELMSLDNSTFSNSELSVLDYNLLPQLFFGDKKFRSNKNETFSKEDQSINNMIGSLKNIKNNDTKKSNYFIKKNISKIYEPEPNYMDDKDYNEKPIPEKIVYSSNNLDTTNTDEKVLQVNKEITNHKDHFIKKNLIPIYEPELNTTDDEEMSQQFNKPQQIIQFLHKSVPIEKNHYKHYLNTTKSEEENKIINKYLNSVKEQQQDKHYFHPKSMYETNLTSVEKKVIAQQNNQKDTQIIKNFEHKPREAVTKNNLLIGKQTKSYLRGSSKPYKVENNKLIINTEEFDEQEILILEK